MTQQNMMRIGLFSGLFILIEALLYNFVDLRLAEFLWDVDDAYPWLIDIFRAYTDLGKGIYNIGAAAISVIGLAFAVRHPRLSPVKSTLALWGTRAFFALTALLTTGILVLLIKHIFGRARPIMWQWLESYGFRFFMNDASYWSFPSGHATTAFTVTFVLMAMFPRKSFLWLIFGVLLGLSRIMVNAHYLSDVIAGAALAWVGVHLVRKATTHSLYKKVKNGIFPIDGNIPTK